MVRSGVCTVCGLLKVFVVCFPNGEVCPHCLAISIWVWLPKRTDLGDAVFSLQESGDLIVVKHDDGTYEVVW